MTKRLWILEWATTRVTVYLSAMISGGFTSVRDVKSALQFKTKQAAIDFKNARPGHWAYEPREIEVEVKNGN